MKTTIIKNITIGLIGTLSSFLSSTNIEAAPLNKEKTQVVKKQIEKGKKPAKKDVKKDVIKEVKKVSKVKKTVGTKINKKGAVKDKSATVIKSKSSNVKLIKKDIPKKSLQNNSISKVTANNKDIRTIERNLSLVHRVSPLPMMEMKDVSAERYFYINSNVGKPFNMKDVDWKKDMFVHRIIKENPMYNLSKGLEYNTFLGNDIQNSSLGLNPKSIQEEYMSYQDKMGKYNFSWNLDFDLNQERNPLKEEQEREREKLDLKNMISGVTFKLKINDVPFLR